MPSLEFLRSNNEIQTEVAARLRQFESRVPTATGKHTLKSGRYRGADTHINHYIAWPQEFVYVGPARKTVSYDELTSEQFTLGYLRILQKQNPDIKERMLDHLTKLLQSSLDYSYESSRGAHAVILQELERGSITWYDSEEIEKIRTLYTNKAATSHDSHNKHTSDNTKRVVCSHYNHGKCKQNSDHHTNNILYRHICMYCYRQVKKAYSHSEMSCHRKQKDNAHN